MNFKRRVIREKPEMPVFSDFLLDFKLSIDEILLAFMGNLRIFGARSKVVPLASVPSMEIA